MAWYARARRRNNSAMTLAYTTLDWGVLAVYVALLALTAYLSSRVKALSAADYFLASRAVPNWLVAISVLSTTQSAATFLGGPDYGYRGDFSYVTSFLGSFLAAIAVAYILLPRFHALGVTTVYGLLENRFGAGPKKAAGAMYLVGRVFASGARLYLAAIAVSMMIFLDVSAQGIFVASLLLLIFGLVFTYVGGLKAVIWSDLVQVIIYVGAALFVLIFLWVSIPADSSAIVHALQNAPDGSDKTRFFNWSLSLADPFSMLAIVTGVMLLNAANFGMDQDTTQRLLACPSAAASSRALIGSVLLAVPVVFIFVAIGQLLHIFYQRPDLMVAGAGGAPAASFQGETITVFMAYILSQIPPGLRGLVTVGVIAAAAINSGINSMASVFIEDFYRPWRARRADLPEAHYLRAGRLAMVGMGVAIFAMSILCYYWQRYADTPLLEFALAVMTFAYSGLLGVYITAVFSQRGSPLSVYAALAVGFVTILLFQDYVIDVLGLPAGLKDVAFPYQLCLGTLLATLVCLAGRSAPLRRAGDVVD
jgi:solute:Na+ symporter, SSS family